MKPFLVLKMGSTLPALKARRGDFEDWIISGLGLARERVTVVDLPGGGHLPESGDPDAVVVSGSHTMVTERQRWSEHAAGWLKELVNAQVPVLGICYGHQLLAHALGGEVTDNPKGREFGTVEVSLSETTRDDPLLGGLPGRIRVHVGHTQSVFRLPEGAVRLASSQWDINQAVRFGPAAWGVQFHPEFDAEITREYVEHYRGLLSAEGQDAERLLSCVVDEPDGKLVLRKFAALVTKED